MTSRLPWWVPVALLALAARLLFLFGAAEPILHAHPYNYFHGAQEIVEHRDPWRFVLTRDEWHRWLGPWTIAPLYYVFLAVLMAVFGQHLLPIQLVQIGLDVLCAVLTARLGREIAGPRGVWAGVAYAVNFHAIEQAPIPLTENIHTVLLLGGMVLLVAEASRAVERRQGGGRGGWGVLAGGAFLIGLSALARAVSTAFVPLAAAWRWWLGRDRGALLRAAVIAAAAAAAVVPWTVRNKLVTGDFIPVETNGIYNFYDDNAFVEGPKRLRQEEAIGAQPTLKERRDLAVRYAMQGIARNPGLFVDKAWRNLLHLVRPDGLQVLLVVEEPMPAWRYAALIVLDDAIVLPTVVLFAVYLLAGRRTAAWGYIAVWTAYYLLMIVGIFHNEIRYRSTLLPFALAGAAGGWQVLAAHQGGRARVRIALASSIALVALVVGPYVVPAARALRSVPPLAAMERALRRGDPGEAERRVREAADDDPMAARPWLRYGRALARAGDTAGALEAFTRAQERKSHVWVPTVVRPALLAALGRPEEAAAATAEANRFSYQVDAWLAQQAAWDSLPPPLADEIRLGDGDYGAVRGFTLPREDGRWSGGRAWLRLRPLSRAPGYDVVLWMGTPEPSPRDSVEVTVRVAGAPEQPFTVARAMKPYLMRVPAPADGVLMARIDAPTWNRNRGPAEQGIFVARMTVSPAREAAGSQ
jgi:hypothetical protein